MTDQELWKAAQRAADEHEDGSTRAYARAQVWRNEAFRARQAEQDLSALHHEARQEAGRLRQRAMEIVDQDARYQAYVDATQHVVREWWKEAMGNLPKPALDLLLGRLQNIDLTMLAPEDKERPVR
jgi:hypothetical protein